MFDLVPTSDGTVLLFACDLLNAGTVEIQSGELAFNSAGYTQIAGQTILNGGNLTMSFAAGRARINGGSLTGVGTVFGGVNNNGGAIEPGLSTGELTIDGDYDQGINATLDIEVGGTNAGEFDALTVTGTATLSGELRVMDIDPFVPQSGDSFVIVTAAAVVGTFDTLTAPDHYVVVYSATEVTLQLAGPSPDLNGDGVVDLEDYGLFQSCYSGSGQPRSASCAKSVNADLDEDGDTDHDDYRLLFAAITQ